MLGAGVGMPPNAPNSTVSSAPFSSRFVDILVTFYKCQRQISNTRTQAHCEWKVECNGQSLSLSVHLEKAMMVSPNALIICNGNTIFPKGWGGETSKRKPGKLVEDFHQMWPVRGIVKAMGVERAVELRHFEGGNETWCLGTLMRQNPNGTFDVLVERRGLNGIMQEEFVSAVNASNLRDAATRNLLQVSERNVVLVVPCNNPVEGAYLSIDGFKQVVQFLGRRSPPPQDLEALPNVVVQVTRDRKTVTANVGHSTFLNHTCGQVRAVSNKSTVAGFGSNSWIIQIGRVQHTIDVWRKSQDRKDITLGVDREVLIEACPEEIKCQQNAWECNFRFVGERTIHFQLCETDASGYISDNKCIVPQTYAFTHMCKISVHDLQDLSSASLYVDGVEFRQLALVEPASKDHQLSLSLSEFENLYKVVVPYTVSHFATRRNSKVANEVHRTSTTSISHDAPGLIDKLVMCVCCSPHGVYGETQNTLIPDVFFTTLHREGSGILAPLSDRNRSPEGLPCGWEGSVSEEEHDYS